MSALDLPLREQAAQIAAGDIDPGELLDSCLARIEERNPDLNAVVATFPEESRRMLEQAPAGPLRGVPVVIKDEWALPWRAETVGAASVPGVKLEPGESGPYRALRDAGAVIAGVANMHELGSGSTGNASVYGAAHNPWDLERCPGGSSSGPAAAVAGGIVAGAVGADGLGSIRYPAAYCGLTGLKPTFGRSAMEGHHIANTETIVSGPLCRDAADCRLLASALFGEDLAAAEASGLRIGVIRDPFWSDTAPGVREACETALESLRAEVDGEVIEVELPDLDLVLPASVLIAQAEEAAHLTPKNLNALSPELTVINRGVLKLRALLPGSLTARGYRVRAKARQDLAELFDGIDLLAWPTVPAVAPPLTEPVIELPSGVESADAGNARQGVIANLTGVPGVSVPVGLDGGMPAALQLLATWGADALLLDAAEALERATDREFVELRPAAIA
ncbi:MAG: aspartyl-tRNA(Asn)/glutamyl-tRNA(Gln) amidotransferase subunit [Solirubrobacterales bacterium]|jgi:Asp-tRNA(Asn)/Glu-tRNA(Gln) amidotransferase A subunit family amidase|nr:aspartyl-tRNA(Asn)/glutamyl-tRNA(Gln) amidotransferase subunit [Solirubrobacterales bacterium]